MDGLGRGITDGRGTPFRRSFGAEEIGRLSCRRYLWAVWEVPVEFAGICCSNH